MFKKTITKIITKLEHLKLCSLFIVLSPAHFSSHNQHILHCSLCFCPDTIGSEPNGEHPPSKSGSALDGLFLLCNKPVYYPPSLHV